MNYNKVFALIGIIMTSCFLIIGLLSYLINFSIDFLLLGIAYGIIGYTILTIIIKTNYDPFKEGSCWAIVLIIFFIILAFSYFPWLPSPYTPMGLYISCPLFSWIIFLICWDFYAMSRKKMTDEDENEL